MTKRDSSPALKQLLKWAERNVSQQLPRDLVIPPGSFPRQNGLEAGSKVWFHGGATPINRFLFSKRTNGTGDWDGALGFHFTSNDWWALMFGVGEVKKGSSGHFLGWVTCATLAIQNPLNLKSKGELYYLALHFATESGDLELDECQAFLSWAKLELLSSGRITPAQTFEQLSNQVLDSFVSGDYKRNDNRDELYVLLGNHFLSPKAAPWFRATIKQLGYDSIEISVNKANREVIVINPKLINVVAQIQVPEILLSRPNDCDRPGCRELHQKAERNQGLWPGNALK